MRKLRWKPGDSHWTTYQQTSTYTDAERDQKTAFVREALSQRHSGLLLDLGCNDGTFSLVGQEFADYVVALDNDEQTIDLMYRRLRAEGNTKILPLVMDLTDPSPAIGWRSQERPSFLDRAKPDAVLALALVHHLAIGANIPLPEVVSWLHSLGGRLVVEFVGPDDPMSRRLLSNKPAGLFPDYRPEVFEKLLGERFEIERQVTLDTRHPDAVLRSSPCLTTRQSPLPVPGHRAAAGSSSSSSARSRSPSRCSTSPGSSPETFVFYRVSGLEVVAYALLIVVVPPVLLWLAVSGIALVSEPAGRVAHAVVAGVADRPDRSAGREEGVRAARPVAGAPRGGDGGRRAVAVRAQYGDPELRDLPDPCAPGVRPALRPRLADG